MNHNQKEVKVTLKKAELLRSTKLCSKMSPYVEIITKNQIYMGAISKHADTKPIWNDVKIIFAEDGEVIKLKLMDFNSREKPELIAEAQLSIIQDFSGNIDLFYQNKKVGQLELQIQKKQNFPQQVLGAVQQTGQQVMQKVSYYVPEIEKYPQFQYPSN